MPQKTMQRTPGHTTIPLEVLKAYGLGQVQSIRPLGNGHVNATFLVQTTTGQYVLQRLAPQLGIVSLRTHRMLTTLLHDKDWAVPLPYRHGHSGHPSSDIFTSSQSQWRCLHYIASDNTPPNEISAKFIRTAAAMLGAWHRDVSELTYRPIAPAIELHDIDAQAKNLRQRMAGLGGQALEISRLLLSTYERLPRFPDAPRQIIHGDPKFDNMLFQGGMPFTFIDFDAVTHGSAWTDVGDMLRSLAGKRLGSGTPFTKSDYKQFATAYHASARLNGMSAEAAYRLTLEAGRCIAAEVAMRYLNDMASDGYLDWDRRAYSSRYAHHLDKAKLQIAVLRQIEQVLKQSSLSISA